MCIHIYIYIYIYICNLEILYSSSLLPPPAGLGLGLGLGEQGGHAYVGAKDCTPEIDTSEITLDAQWHFPMDFQRHFPKDFFCLCDVWCVIFCPERRRAPSAPRRRRAY